MRGLALETVDGGVLEDVTVSNISMRDLMNAPIFLRLGRRLRAPANTAVGAIRRVQISNVIAYNVDARYAATIAGVPDHQIHDIALSNIRIFYRGGGKPQPADVQMPERETNYPEPSMFGELPAYGFFIRHVQGVEFNDVSVSYFSNERRPPFLLDDVTSARFNHVNGYRATGAPMFMLKNVSDFNMRACGSVPDVHLDKIVQKTLN